ncbi:MAG: GNAT family N-acetyltransferase [Candidatus Helarchaeota archaeon]|nr:GNAT family N-acetyltransferase [Candidatus Helarchaeota archaeon]
MELKIRKLKEPYPFKQIADHLRNIYYQEYGKDGTLIWDEGYTKYYFDANVAKEISKDFAFGTFTGKKLIGTLFGHWDLVRIGNKQTLEMLNLGLMTVSPEYRRQGIAKRMLNQLIEQAKERNIDLITALPQKGRYGDKLLKEHFDFVKFAKTKHLLKLMEEQGVKAARLQLGIIVGKIATLFSHIPNLGDPEGIIRIGKSEDLERAIALINSYSDRIPLSTIYTKKGFQHTLREFDSLATRFGAPWGHQWLLLERNGELYATVCCRVEKIAYEIKGGLFEEIYAALLSSLAFHEKMDSDEKRKFIAYILRKILIELPEISCTQITTHQYEPKAFKKLRFADDRNSYFLYMKAISEKGEIINQHVKFKEFFIEYYR